jgi:uncharacterized membrane protein
MTTSLFAILLVFLSSMAGAVAGFLMKVASKEISFKPKNIIKNYVLIMGLAIYVVSTLVYIFALTKGELNSLYPISATTYIWSSLMASVFFHEKLNKYKWIGISLIIIGAILIVR